VATVVGIGTEISRGVVVLALDDSVGSRQGEDGGREGEDGCGCEVHFELK
jgi:hypothetical protein